MDYRTQKITIPDFTTLCGDKLLAPEACYTMYGDFDVDKKIALIFHGFSSNSELHTWWEKFKFDRLLDTYNIICINSLGSSYGTTGPESINPITKAPYFQSFPQITIQDTVNFSVETLKTLNIEKVDIAFGCSLGGMQILDMFLRYPEVSDKFVSVAGVPVPYMTKLINLAQARLIDQANNGSRTALESALGHSRFFFRLFCTTEDALKILNDKRNQGNNNRDLDTLESYFVEDNLKFQTQFSPYSNSLYLKLIANFGLPEIKPLHLSNNHLQSKLLLVSIENDLFTPDKYIKSLFNIFRNKGYSVDLREFDTKYGHEAWIVDGERFYEFIEKYLHS